MGHQVFNYGMYTPEDECQLTYVQVGILAAVLLNSGAADYVITGCGTGEGAFQGIVLLSERPCPPFALVISPNGNFHEKKKVVQK